MKSIGARFAMGAMAAAMIVGAQTAGSPAALGQACPDFGAGQSLGIAQDASLTEASGIVASRKNPGILWIHNDSPDISRLFAFAKDGTHRADYILQGASQVDWEDIALGSGPTPGEDYLYVGDIGDNAMARASVTIYRVAEPHVDALTSGTITLAGIDAMTLTYPSGPRNAETLLFDPVSGDLWIVTKILSATAELYRKPAPHVAGAAALVAAGTIQPGVFTTGGDISPSGDGILIRTYTDARFWSRLAGQTIQDALAGTPCIVPLASEPQGEAIGFAPGGCGYYTISEGTSQPIYFFPRTNYCSVSINWSHYN